MLLTSICAWLSMSETANTLFFSLHFLSFSVSLAVLIRMDRMTHYRPAQKAAYKDCGLRRIKHKNERKKERHFQHWRLARHATMLFSTCRTHKIYEPLFSIRAVHRKPQRQSQGDEGSGSARFDPWSLNWHNFVVHVLNRPWGKERDEQAKDIWVIGLCFFLKALRKSRSVLRRHKGEADWGRRENGEIVRCCHTWLGVRLNFGGGCWRN